MSWSLDDLTIQHQLNVGLGVVPFFGLGPARVRGAAFIEGPMNVGTPFAINMGTVNIGPLINPDAPVPFIPGGFCYGPPANPFSLAVIGSVGILGELNVATNAVIGGMCLAQLDVHAFCGVHRLSNKKDLPFDMPHPNKDGWRLRHVCIEGPEIAVYCRGKIPPNGIIELPSFWDGLVNKEDMSINLTPFGTWQELFVQEIRWGKQVIVRNNLGGPIKGDYHIVARRLDDDLIVEYEGESHEDYPAGNEGYSFNFEHDYVKGLIQDMVDKKVKTIMENN